MAPGITGRIWSGVRNLAEGASEALDSTINEHRIRLAVTGLSRSGKTVFITSLIQNLLALGQGCDTLPRLSARLSQSGQSRLRGVKILPPGSETIPVFDFRTNLAALASENPSWPERTQNLAQISLVLLIERQSGLAQKLGQRRIRLDILDYPGEWLLDLPMLQLSFEAWSAATIARLASPPRAEHAGEFLAFIHTLRSTDPADEHAIRHGHLLYRQGIEACRSSAGLRYLQPGRFLCPGPQGDAPFLWFFPLPMDADGAPPGSIGAILRSRFETYKRQVRADFFDVHFRAFNRQIVLIDVLGALYAGEAAFADTRRAVEDLATSLQHGWGFWSRARRKAIAEGLDAVTSRATVRAPVNAGLSVGAPVALASTAVSALVAPRPIERVAFVATKADHVGPLNRTNLRHLLRGLASPAATSWEGEKAEVSYHIAASVRSTQDGIFTRGERHVEVVEGIILGDNRVRPFDVGQVPVEVPQPGFWNGRFFEMPVFRPPVIDPGGSNGIRHLGLDDVLDAVIGDLL